MCLVGIATDDVKYESVVRGNFALALVPHPPPYLQAYEKLVLVFSSVL